jgi:hypothetical protein
MGLASESARIERVDARALAAGGFTLLCKGQIRMKNGCCTLPKDGTVWTCTPRKAGTLQPDRAVGYIRVGHSMPTHVSFLQQQLSDLLCCL